MEWLILDSLLVLDECVVTASLEEYPEFLFILGEDLVLNLGLLDCQLQHELVFLVELVLEGVGEDGEHIQFASLVELDHLDAVLLADHLLVELRLVDHPLVDVTEDQLASISDLGLLLHRVLHKTGPVHFVRKTKEL